MALSDTWLKANHSKQRDSVTEKSDRDGLSVRVSEKGKIKFQMRFRFAGKNQRCDIGTYPLMGLADARKECQRYRAELEQGKDPRLVKKLEREAVMYAGTFEEMFRQWHSSTKADQVSGAEILATFEKHVFPSFGRFPAGDLTMHVWLDFLEKQTKARPYIAQRILTNLKMVYRWAVKRQLTEHNPVADIFSGEDLNIEKSETNRVLSADEIRLVYEALENSTIWPKNKILIELCLFYGCRVSELRLAERDHFDFKKMVWTVPVENHKMGDQIKKALVRPIIPEVVPLLQMLMDMSGGRYLFPHRDEDRPVSDRSHIKIPSQLTTWLRENRKVKMDSWSVHDLRRTARTNWSSLTDSDIAEIMLGHKLPGVKAVYDHHDYLPRQQAAYKAWWERLQRIRNQEQSDNVVEMKRG